VRRKEEPVIHPGRFVGKTGIVTGGAQGIGRTVAMNMAREGGTIVLVDRSDLVHEVVAEITAAGGTAFAVIADLEQYTQCCQVMQTTQRHYNRIDILINNVGGTIWAKPFAHYHEAEIEAEVRRSLFPTMWCCRAVLPFMLESNGGVIVNVSSVATRGINRAPYAAAKGGVNALTASLAFEYASHGIRVCAVAPGGTDAPPRKIPRNTAQPSLREAAWYQQVVDQTTSSSLMKRYGTAEEQAAAILFFASDEASYITGVTLPVAGGDLG